VQYADPRIMQVCVKLIAFELPENIESHANFPFEQAVLETTRNESKRLRTFESLGFGCFPATQTQTA
jgi:hypothetical protein